MRPDGFFDLQQTVADCVCAQMNDLAAEDPTYPGCACLVFVSPGEPTIDCCTDCGESDGRLTVHIEDIFPSDVFPSSATTFEPCKAHTWVVGLVVTVARCLPQKGPEPEPVDLVEAARTQAIDAYAVMTALGCCVVKDPPAGKRKRRVLVTGSSPLTEQGGCTGLEVRALVEAGSVCSCQQES